MIDLDIRKGTLSRHYGHHHVGITNYLSDSTIRVDDIIQRREDFDLIASLTGQPTERVIPAP